MIIPCEEKTQKRVKEQHDEESCTKAVGDSRRGQKHDQKKKRNLSRGFSCVSTYKKC